jgi:hypothetical protein
MATSTPPAPVATPKPTVNNSKKSFLGGKLSRGMAAAIAAVVLAVGGAGAYFGVIVPSKPENVLKKAVITSLEQQDKLTIKGKISFEDLKAESGELRAVDVDLTVGWDDDAQKMLVSVEANVAGIKLPVELRVVDKNIYFKLGDLNSVINAAGLAGNEYAAILEEINNSIANQWFVIDNNFLKQFKAECITDFTTDEDIQFVIDAYKENDFATVKSSSKEQLNGKSAHRMVLNIDSEKAKTFLKKLEDAPTSKKQRESGCLGGDSSTSNSEEEFAKELSKRNNELVVWVQDGRVVKAEATSSTSDNKVTFTATIEYVAPTIDKPTDAKPVTDLLSEFGPALEGFDFSQGTTDTPTDLGDLQDFEVPSEFEVN